jgi:hypothetical protein
MSGEADTVAVPEELVSEGHEGLDVATAADDLHDDVEPNVWGRPARVLVSGRFILGLLVFFTRLLLLQIKVVGDESAQRPEQPRTGIKLDAAVICFSLLVSLARSRAQQMKGKRGLTLN